MIGSLAKFGGPFLADPGVSWFRGSTLAKLVVVNVSIRTARGYGGGQGQPRER